MARATDGYRSRPSRDLPGEQGQLMDTAPTVHTTRAQAGELRVLIPRRPTHAFFTSPFTSVLTGLFTLLFTICTRASLELTRARRQTRCFDPRRRESNTC